MVKVRVLEDTLIDDAMQPTGTVIEMKDEPRAKFLCDMGRLEAVKEEPAPVPEPVPEPPIKTTKTTK